MLDRELNDPRLKAVYATLSWGWIGAPPSHASFLAWAVMMGTYVEDGAYYIRGSFQRLADALAAGLEKHGGELLLGTRVARILSDDGRVTGVYLDGARRIAAPTVVSAIDARTTFEDLVGAERLPARFLRRLRARELSPSTVSIHVGTDLDARALGARHDTSVARTWDLERVIADALRARIQAAHVVIPSLTDPALAPAGEHVVMVQGPAARESGEAPHDDRRIADDLLSYAEDVLPGLRTSRSPNRPATKGRHHTRRCIGWVRSTAG